MYNKSRTYSCSQTDGIRVLFRRQRGTAKQHKTDRRQDHPTRSAMSRETNWSHRHSLRECSTTWKDHKPHHNIRLTLRLMCCKRSSYLLWGLTTSASTGGLKEGLITGHMVGLKRNSSTLSLPMDAHRLVPIVPSKAVAVTSLALEMTRETIRGAPLFPAFRLHPTREHRNIRIVLVTAGVHIYHVQVTRAAWCPHAVYFVVLWLCPWLFICR